jgi:hypothetical protein
MQPRPSLAAGVVATVVLFAAAAGLQWLRETRFAPPPAAPAEHTLYVTSGTAARRLTLGFDTLAADLYWIRAIQHFGGEKQRVEKDPASRTADSAYALLYPLLDHTTTLDPYFNIAYRFGALFLTEPFPGGAGRPDQAIALLEKGLAVRPDKWEYMWDIGFVHYWWLHDYEAAASWFRRAAQVTGAPWWLESLAATTLSEGGNRAASRQMWLAILESAEVDYQRRDAERRLLQLDALDVIDELQRRVDRLHEARGAAPTGWDALVQARLIGGVPVDPTGVPFELSTTGRVQLSPQSPLYPLPAEPRQLPAL